jgi:hypothetical protein
VRVVSAVILAALVVGCDDPALRPRHDATGDAAPEPFTPFKPVPLAPATGAAASGPASSGAGGMAASPGPATGGTGGMPTGPGAAGTSGVMPPPPAFCEDVPAHQLPLSITTDFLGRFVLQGELWAEQVDLACDQETFPDAAPSPAVPPETGLPGRDAPLATVATCVAFKYDPDPCVLGPGGACWAGAIFTPSPLGFAGQGICVQPGATVIHFNARASKDGARVKFGSIREGLGGTEFFLELTRQWRSYTISIPAGEDYNAPAGVWNGFSVIAEPQDHAGGTYILVADVTWSE